MMIKHQQLKNIINQIKYTTLNIAFKYHIKKIDNLTFKSKYSFLVEFYYDLQKFNNLDPPKEYKNKNKINKCVCCSF